MLLRLRLLFLSLPLITAGGREGTKETHLARVPRVDCPPLNCACMYISGGYSRRLLPVTRIAAAAAAAAAAAVASRERRARRECSFLSLSLSLFLSLSLSLSLTRARARSEGPKRGSRGSIFHVKRIANASSCSGFSVTPICSYERENCGLCN